MSFKGLLRIFVIKVIIKMESLIPDGCEKCCCNCGILPSGEECYFCNGFGYVRIGYFKKN